MATKEAKMRREGEARNRLVAAMASISAAIGGRPMNMPQRQRDPEMTPVVYLETFADWAERIERRLSKVVEAGSDGADE